MSTGHARPTPPELRDVLVELHRSSWGRVLAAVARSCDGNLDVAEESTQDAFVAALESWPRSGVPRQPVAWLVTTARHRALDRLRRETTLRRKLPLLAHAEDDVASGPDTADDAAVPDERLALVLACCHPALGADARVALTLRLVCGLTTAEIASALVVSETTMAARLTRAKKKVAAAHIPLRVPSPDELGTRLASVLDVIQLVYTTGHTPPSGAELSRADLAARALDLAGVLAVLVPHDPEALGLLASLLLTQARAPARIGADGRPVLLEDQDRTRWDSVAVRRGLAHLMQARRALGSGRAGRFLLQAEITAVHASAPTYGATDWDRLLALHDALCAVWANPVARLNRAAAIALARGAAEGLAALDEAAADPRLAGYRHLPAARAELLRRLGRYDEAATAYEQAIGSCDNETQRAFLERQLQSVRAANGDGNARGER